MVVNGLMVKERRFIKSSVFTISLSSPHGRWKGYSYRRMLCVWLVLFWGVRRIQNMSSLRPNQQRQTTGKFWSQNFTSFQLAWAECTGKLNQKEINLWKTLTINNLDLIWWRGYRPISDGVDHADQEGSVEVHQGLTLLILGADIIQQSLRSLSDFQELIQGFVYNGQSLSISTSKH